MVKISISSTKYVILGKFSAEGLIEKTDLIGSFFGQTEGLIGDDLEFANLQKNGKLGRIEITLKKLNNKTEGKFEIPTALNKTEVSLVAAAIESITKIGHTQGKIQIIEIRDERKKKRDLILKRAEELLNNLKEELPQSNQITQKIDENLKLKSITKYDKYYGGPNIRDEKKIILVEGRSDVLNLIKNGISNVLCFNGTNFDDFLIEICNNKEITLFLDDDNAGHKHFFEIKSLIKVDYVTYAPNGFEVSDLNLKEINTALKNKKRVNNFKMIKKFKRFFKKE